MRESISLRVLVAESRFYEDIADELCRGAASVLEKAGASFDRVAVMGVLELPPVLAMAVESRKYDAYVMLGCVIRGETSHYDIVTTQSARGIMDLAVSKGLAVGNGILTVETPLQAWERASVKKGDKGGFAAHAALCVAALRPLFGD